MDGVGVGGFVVLIIAVVIYFLPSIVAGNKGHPHAGGIFVVNIFLGWTLLGWVIALAWAASYSAPKPAPAPAPPANSFQRSLSRHFCLKCNAPAELEDKFCRSCGAPVKP